MFSPVSEKVMVCGSKDGIENKMTSCVPSNSGNKQLPPVLSFIYRSIRHKGSPPNEKSLYTPTGEVKAVPLKFPSAT